MTVHPGYAGNGFLYVYYTSRDWDGPGGIVAGDVVIERYTRDATDPERADPASGRLILVIHRNPASGNHNGGDIRFGADGYLYATIGDGGGGCDSASHSGQDLAQLLGKMLRLDVDGPDAFLGDPLRNYAIPADNPLVGVAGADEIWALGLRNPFRFNFDRVNGDVYIGDVGQDDWEEIDLLPAGGVVAGAPVNFGWPCREGFDPSGCADPPQGCGPASSYTEPVRVEPNPEPGAAAIIGGFRYRGTEAAADLDGHYVYGDASKAEVREATVSGMLPAPGWPSTQLFTGDSPFAFGEDHLGELYMLSASLGRVACIQTTGDTCTDWASGSDGLVVFGDGFESGDAGAWGMSVP
jgi:glucose/arabinose dehydrogenase